MLSATSSNSTLNSLSAPSRTESLNTLKHPGKKFTPHNYTIFNIGMDSSCCKKIIILLGKRQFGGGQSSLSEFSEHSSMELDLEFDLYDYEHKRMICDTSDPGDSYDGDTVHSRKPG